MPELSIPYSLKVEHDELHLQLEKAINAGGKTGDAAKIVAELLHPHFKKEEEYAMPPLGLLTYFTGQEGTENDKTSLVTLR